MLTHGTTTAVPPERVVLLGGSGFVGKALTALLREKNMPVQSFSSRELDLLALDAADQVTDLLRDGDAVVMLSALTPDKGRDIATLMRNLRMAEAVCAAFSRRPVAHVVYVSSDAVYPLSLGLVSEASAAEPTDLYSTMHRAREVMFQTTAGSTPFAILRPTLIYGAGDTHNSYGPNRFRRLAAKDGTITVGGEGEETRDHIYVGDVAELIHRVLQRRSSGILNLVTGRSTSYAELGRLVAAQFAQPVEVKTSPRQSPITHRRFDVAALWQAFPNFVPTPLQAGLPLAQADLAGVK